MEQVEERSSIARVYLVPGTGRDHNQQKRSIDDYFGLETFKDYRSSATCRLQNTTDKYDANRSLLRGGGFTGQAGAIRHGIARALLTGRRLISVQLLRRLVT